MSEPLVYLNGRDVLQHEAALPFHDAGFVFGATVTDLCRTFRHQLYRLDDHLQRFRQSCALARVPQTLSDAELTAIAEQLVEENSRLLHPNADLALVMFATPGPIGYYLGQTGSGGPTLGMHTFPLPMARFHRLFREGARLVIPKLQRPTASLDPRIKQRSRLLWWLAEQEAHDLDPAASALLLDDTGHVTETAAANLLLVRGGTVLTPPRGTVLNGVSLLTVEELCRQLDVPFREEPLTLTDCLTADEALLSCTSYCLASVSHINGQAIPTGGPIYRQLLAAWSRAVGLDIRAQILANG
ncbi:MAG: aminotransferase class IV [Planctomycetia bacterium]|nr:aminotransferase class IV [Planctomycetia bacterium]